MLDYFKNIFKSNHSLNKDKEVVKYFDKPFIQKEYINHPNAINPYQFSNEEYQNFHNQFLNNDFFLNTKNQIILQNIHEEILRLINLLEPLKIFGTKFELVLTGGALRDFILNKSEQINDLDITINLTNNYRNFKDKDQVDLITHLLEKNKIDYYKLSDKKKQFDRIDMYKNLHHLLHDVIEIQGKNYPIQLLFTNNSKQLIDNFDFDICKIGLRLFSDHYSFKNASFPTSIDEYISRLEYDETFISHVLKKELSYHNSGKTIEQVNYELTNHLPRIMSKYPDFSITIFSESSDNYDYTKELLNKILFFKKLDNNFVKTNKTIKNKKI